MAAGLRGDLETAEQKTTINNSPEGKSTRFYRQMSPYLVKGSAQRLIDLRTRTEAASLRRVTLCAR